MKCPLYILCLATASVYSMSTLPTTAVELGDTRATVIDELGEPMGESTTRGITTLFYSGGGIDLKAGRVIEVAPHFDERADYRERMQQYKEQQNAKGLYKYNGSWLTKQGIERRETHRLRKEAALQAEADAKAAAAAAREQRRAAAMQAAKERHDKEQTKNEQVNTKRTHAACSRCSSTAANPSSGYFSNGGANRGHTLGITKGSYNPNTTCRH